MTTMLVQLEATLTIRLALFERLSIVTVSPATGAVAPDTPPEVAAQLDVEFQFEVPPDMRKRAAMTL